MMPQDYLHFLEDRAAQRRLAARFARPRWLLLHTLIFVTAITVMWNYGVARQLIFNRAYFDLPMLVGTVWSGLLAAHAFVHYRRSAAHNEKRELAVEAEMRLFIERNGDNLDQGGLFAMHHRLDADLQQQGRWSLALLAFAVVNMLTWLVSLLNISPWWTLPLQMTWPLALLIIGGVNVFVLWQQKRQFEVRGWFTRLPLRHIVAYLFGSFGLVMLATNRLINSWDARTLILYWTVALVLHILVGEIVQPILAHFLPSGASVKQKPAVPLELVIGDDGEVLDIADHETKQYQARTL
ncbi:MAG: hypothetical protein ABI700_15140 [Chloroflexota bacterium]